MYIFPIPCRHATLCNPRALHLKNQFAESIASSTLLPINRRSLSETVRRGFIHRSDQSFSPQRFFSSISKHGFELTDPGGLSESMLELQPELRENWKLPALPKIKDKQIENQVFTHRSFYARPAHEFEDSPEDPSPDNECLEFLGDKVLDYVVTDLIQQEYPHLRVGSATKIRSRVVENNQLAEVSKQYKLPQRLRVQEAQAASLRSSRSIQADVFEAYVGGLHKDQGLVTVKEWITPLLMPYIKEAHSLIKAEHDLARTNSPGQAFPSPPSSPTPSDRDTSLSNTTSDEVNEVQPAQRGYVTLLTQYCTREKVNIGWEYGKNNNNGTTPIWIARLSVDNREITSGSGVTKKEARENAAMKAAASLGLT